MVEPKTTIESDVIIVGAGISGINAGYRVQTELPDCSYTILEARADMGGTWDLFRFPGIRSDSDLHTFGFAFHPWMEERPIVDGPSIAKYIKDTAAHYGIDQHIRFNNRLTSANWSSKQQRWELTVDADGQTVVCSTPFVIFGTGYYNYEEPLPATIPGLANFKGTTVHPQLWPEDLDYTGKRIALIGSGATAVTLLPNLAQKASLVTMIQRSPSYILSLPNRNTKSLARMLLPEWLAFKLDRLRFLVVSLLFFYFCRAFPGASRWILQLLASRQLPKTIATDPHFQPRYDPWEQRLCVCPDGDFYQCLKDSSADVVTGHIKTVVENGVIMESGQKVDADIIVTATGLKLRIAGGAALTVDGAPVGANDKFLWNGAMLQDIPNCAFVIGYTNASWTLGADATAILCCRILKQMRAKGVRVAVPRVAPGATLNSRPLLDLNSTYVVAAKGVLPKAGDVGPWRPRTNYFGDLWHAKYGNITEGIEYTKA